MCSPDRHDRLFWKAFKVFDHHGGNLKNKDPTKHIREHRGIHYTPHILPTEAQSTIRAESLLTIPSSEMLRHIEKH